MDAETVQYHCCPQCQGLFPDPQALLDHKDVCTGDKVTGDASMFAVDRQTFLRLAAQAKATHDQSLPSKVPNQLHPMQARQFINKAGAGPKVTVRIVKKSKDGMKSEKLDINDLLAAKDKASQIPALKTFKLVGIKHGQSNQIGYSLQPVVQTYKKIVRKNVRGKVLSQMRLDHVNKDKTNKDLTNEDLRVSQVLISSVAAKSESVSSQLNPPQIAVIPQPHVSTVPDQSTSLTSGQSEQTYLPALGSEVVVDSQSREPSGAGVTGLDIPDSFTISAVDEKPELIHIGDTVSDEQSKVEPQFPSSTCPTSTPHSQVVAWEPVKTESMKTDLDAEQTDGAGLMQQTGLDSTITKLIWKPSNFSQEDLTAKTSGEQDRNQTTDNLYGLEKLSDIASRVDRKADSNPPQDVLETLDTIMNYEQDTSSDLSVKVPGRQKRKKNSLRLFTCCICPYKTRFLGMYRRHLGQAHNGGEKFKCDMCGAEFLYRRLFKVHLNTHMGFDCNHCDKKFSRANDRDRHIKQIHAAEKIAYECDQCQYVTSYKNMIMEHLRKHTGVKLACPVVGCPFLTIYQRALHHHRNTVHNPDKRFQCSCLYTTNDSNLFQRHMQLHDACVPEKCLQCDYSSIVPRNMRQHQRSHSKQLYCCNRCDYSTNNKSTFRSHVLWHEGMWPWNCSLCDHGATCKGSVQKHMEKEHGGKGQVIASRHTNVNVEAYCKYPSTNVATLSSEEQEGRMDEEGDRLEEEGSMDEEEGDRLEEERGHQEVAMEEEMKEDMVVEAGPMIIGPDQPLYQCAFCEFSSFNLDDVQQHLVDDHPDQTTEQSPELAVTQDVEYISVQVLPADDLEQTEMTVHVAEVPEGAEAEAAESILHLQDAPVELSYPGNQEQPA